MAIVDQSKSRGYHEIIGRASFVDDSSNARLNVYFFGNIGAPYGIIDLDDTVMMMVAYRGIATLRPLELRIS